MSIYTSAVTAAIDRARERGRKARKKYPPGSMLADAWRDGYEVDPATEARVAWRITGTGESGHGEWMTRAEAQAEHDVARYGDGLLTRWVELRTADQINPTPSEGK